MEIVWSSGIGELLFVKMEQNVLLRTVAVIQNNHIKVCYRSNSFCCRIKSEKWFSINFLLRLESIISHFPFNGASLHLRHGISEPIWVIWLRTCNCNAMSTTAIARTSHRHFWRGQRCWNFKASLDKLLSLKVYMNETQSLQVNLILGWF